MTRRTPDDHARFDRVYAANLPLILGYAARRCAEPTDAADVAAEVFTVAWRRLGEVPAGEERLWLFGVARRVLANQRRGHIRRHKLADRLRDELTANPPVAQPNETAALVLDAIAQLPERDREILRLAVWDGLSPAEIAELERVPAATVRSRLMRARARLREVLTDVLAEAVGVGVQRPTGTGHVPGGAPSMKPTTRSTDS